MVCFSSFCFKYYLINNLTEKILFLKYLVWLHPGNQTLWKSLSSCMERIESIEKKERSIHPEIDAKNVRYWILNELSSEFEELFEKFYIIS